MLTESCHIVFGNEVSEGTCKVSAFELRFSNKLAASNPGDSIHWQPVDTERFRLIANESLKVGRAVNRLDADYWIEQIKARAMAEGERVGRVKVAEENTGALVPVKQ